MAIKEEAQGTWNRMAGAIKAKYEQITGEDVDSAHGNVRQLAGVIHNKTGKAREEIEEFLQSISDNTVSATKRISDAAGDMATKAEQSLRDGYDYAYEASRDGIKAATETVQKRPGNAMLLAIGVGVLTGLLLGKSMFRARS